MQIKAAHTLLMSTPRRFSTDGKGSWLIPLPPNLKVDARINYGDRSLKLVIRNYQISKETLKQFRQNTDDNLEAYSQQAQKEISQIHTHLSEASKKLLSLIKYHLNQLDISEQLWSIKSRYWSEDGDKWKPIPSNITASIEGRRILSLDEKTATLIQTSLNNDITPLLAMRHLHRARQERISHHKWIDATIAAELAIKEVLIRAEPKL